MTTSFAELLEMAAVPSEREPSRKLIVPVALVPAGGCTVAVKVMPWPTIAGLAEEETEVEVPARFTVSVSAVEVLAAKVVSPLYLAVMECGPAASEDTGS